MNSPQKNNGWILCRSKSFPGKFYHFNVFSGQTVWSINDDKKKVLSKNENVSKNINNFVCDSDPCSPSSHNSSNMESFRNVHTDVKKPCTQFIPQVHGSDQAYCPNYLTNANQYVPNIIWMPLNLPTQTYVPSPRELNKQECYPRYLNKDMQEKCVQTSDIKMTNSLVNGNNNNYNSNNFTNSDVFWKCYRDNNNITDISNLCHNYNKLRITHNRTSLEFKQKEILKDTSLKLPNNFESNSYSISGFNKNIDTTNSNKDYFYFNAEKLDKSDLRYILATKKEHQIKIMGTKGHANKKCENPHQPYPLKKCVTTFGHASQISNLNLKSKIEENHINNENNVESEKVPTSESLNICTFLKLKKFIMSPSEWFIVVDLNVLMSDFQYIINIVRRDKTCQLMIVYAVLSKIWELSRLDNQFICMAARHLIKQISSLTQYITIFEEENFNDSPIPEQILNCCKKIIEKEYRMIIITDGAELYAKGKSLNLDCYTLKEFKGKVKDNYYEKDKMFDVLNNDNINKNNLFLQYFDTLKTFKFGEKEEVINKSNDTGKININHQYIFKRDDLKIIRRIENTTAMAQNEFDETMPGKLGSFVDDTGKITTRQGKPDIQAKTTKTCKENIMNLESLNAKLKKFYLKNKAMEDRLTIRVEEFICTFTQIMEAFMLDLLQNSSASKYPCTFLEGADEIAKLFHDNKYIQMISYRMSALYNLINPNGKLSNNINPNDVIKTFGCGLLLVEYIKNIDSDVERLPETHSLLLQLFSSIEDPESDDISKENEIILEDCRKKNTVNTEKGSEHTYESPKICFKKKPSEVLQYLQNHYPEWQNGYKKLEGKDEKEQLIVYRTTGLNVNLLKITNSKNIVLDEKAAVNEDIEHNKTEVVSEPNKVTDSNTAKLYESQRYLKRGVNNSAQNQVSLNVNENTFTTNQQVDSGPKVVRKCGIIKAFENKILRNPLDKVKCKFNDNVIMTSENGIATKEKVDKPEDTSHKMFCDIKRQANDTEKESSSHRANGGSGLSKEYCNGQAFIKSFLIHLSSSLKIIYNFLNDSALKIGNGNIAEDNKKEIFNKTNKTHKELTAVIDKLKRIIEREQDTSKISLGGNFADVDDKRMSRYKQVVTKCLEQAELLHKGLKTLLCIINENCDPLLTLEPDECNTGYYNIFE